MANKVYRIPFLIVLTLLTGNSTFAQKTTIDSEKSYVIEWSPIRESDILWKKRIWREIAIYEKSNAAFLNTTGVNAENVYANILLKGLKTGAFNAYADQDTLFTTPLTMVTIASLITCKPPDTAYVTTCVYPQQVEFYDLVEDWIFDRNKGQMVVRIAAIAPVAMEHGHKKPLFWVKYPEIRSYISRYEVNAGKDPTKYRYTWDEYFESRQFSSKITDVEGGIHNSVTEQPYVEKKRDWKTRKHKKHKSRKEIFNKEANMWVY